MTATATPTAQEYCGAKTRSGTSCKRPAGWGTPHTGRGACKLHGGSTPSSLIAAARDEASVMGAPVDIEPHEALLACVRIAAGQVKYCSDQVAQLKEEEAVQRIVHSESGIAYTENGPMDIDKEKDLGPELHIWIRVQQEALDRLAKYSKMAIDAGVAERQVALAERWGEHLAGVLDQIFDRLGLSPRQRKIAPTAVRETLETIEGIGVEL